MKEFRENDRVKINNIYPWTIGFSSGYSGQTVSIPPNAKENISLTVESVKNAINNQNVGFVGCDGRGTRAAFQIIDPEMREYLFGSQDEPYYYSKEHVKELLAKATKATFTKALDVLVTNNAEARAVLDACFDPEQLNIPENYPGWKCNLIEYKCKELLGIL